MKTYQKNIHFPLDEQFKAGGKIYTKIEQNNTHCLYEVTDPNNGDPYTYFELFQLKKYKPTGKYQSQYLNEGDYYYPVDEDFGVWAACLSNKKIAMERWNKIMVREG